LSIAVPPGFYSAVPRERVNALKLATSSLRQQLLEGSPPWPMYSPGSLNAWLLFLGPSPGASPGKAPWNYDPLPSIGSAHPGVARYHDARGFWDGIRLFARTVFPELPAGDAYAAAMVRNFDERQRAVGPRGRHMIVAGREVVSLLDRVIRPRMVVALGGVREYSDRVFCTWPGIGDRKHGCLYTARRGDERQWFSLSGRWSTGEHFLYLSPSGIHPSLSHVSRDDTLEFLSRQGRAARGLGSLPAHGDRPMVRRG
jgi:hypothetical protein